MEAFLTVTEAVALTGKSRRTITRRANRLHQEGSDLVMHEKTARGYIWRISASALQETFGFTNPQTVPAIEQNPPSPQPAPVEPEASLEIARQGYAGMMAMHQEVKQVYEALLVEKEQRIQSLRQELAQSRKGLWGWLVGD